MVAAAGRADPPPDSGPTAAGESSGAIWERCCAESQAAALFLMAPMIAVSMAPPAPPATACETIPLTLKFPDCAAARTEGSNRVATCPSSPPPTRPEMMFPAVPRSNVGDDLPAPTPPSAPATRLIRICSMSISCQIRKRNRYRPQFCDGVRQTRLDTDQGFNDALNTRLMARSPRVPDLIAPVALAKYPART